MTDLSDKHGIILDCSIGYPSNLKDVVYGLKLEITYVPECT